MKSASANQPFTPDDQMWFSTHPEPSVMFVTDELYIKDVLYVTAVAIGRCRSLVPADGGFLLVDSLVPW